jgi:hypothetical protein
MGLLDDAIREHLELKRRHGADPGEIERQEQEALGSARRGEFAPEGGPAPPPAPFDADEAVPEAIEPPEYEEATPEAAAVAAGFDEDPWLEEERDEVPAEESLEPPPEEEEPPAAEAGEQREDVLEETPEFLQETPEHDRLWFEQRPPRDFDWDK